MPDRLLKAQLKWVDSVLGVWIFREHEEKRNCDFWQLESFYYWEPYVENSSQPKINGTFLLIQID